MGCTQYCTHDQPHGAIALTGLNGDDTAGTLQCRVYKFPSNATKHQDATEPILSIL